LQIVCDDKLSSQKKARCKINYRSTLTTPIKVFKKEVTSGCSTHSKAYFETIEEEYPASMVYKHNAAR